MIRPIWRRHLNQERKKRERGDADYVEGTLFQSMSAACHLLTCVFDIADPFEGQYNVATDECVDKIDYVRFAISVLN